MRLSIKLLLFYFAIVIYSGSCIFNDVAESTEVITEDILFVSGDNIKFIGRILSIGKDPIIDHGFEVTTDSTFIEDLAVISLGKINKLGKFVGTLDGLIPSTKYYYRAFVTSINSKKESDFNLFFTLNVSLESFNPTSAKEGDVISIFGRNFTAESEVYFDNIKAEVISIENESLIIVKVPAPTRKESIISVIYNNETIKFNNPFKYIIGSWSESSKFISNTSFFEAFGVVDNNEFLFGFGRDYNLNLNDTIWALDFNNWQWSIKSTGLGFGRSSFNVGNIWGSGAEEFPFGSFFDLNNHLRQYINGNIIQLNNLPFKLYRSIGVMQDGETYVLGGLDEDKLPNTIIYRYDKPTDSWVVLTTVGPEVTSVEASFSYNNLFYYLDGEKLLSFNLSSFEIAELSNYPGRVGEEGISCIIDNKAYIGLLGSGVDIWEYNIENNEWIQKRDFIGNHREQVAQYFVYNNNIYVLKAKFQGGAFDSDKRMDMWKFNPNEL